MTSRYPHHALFLRLLEKKHFEACRDAVDDEIEQVMASENPDDHELAALQVLSSRTLLAMHEYEAASDKASIGAFLARKAKDPALMAEAQFLAGEAFERAGNHRSAIRQFTECLKNVPESHKAKTLYNRGNAYDSLGAYAYAVPDYEAALELAESDSTLTRLLRINLVWALIMLREFTRAEAILEELSRSASVGDEALQLQLAHDRLHVAYQTFHHADALRQAVVALRQAGDRFPQVKAHITLTLMALATDRSQSQDALALGVFSKRLAGRADRSDLDQEANLRMRRLEVTAGTDCLVESLLQIGQLLPGAISSKKAQRRLQQAGGAS